MDKNIGTINKLKDKNKTDMFFKASTSDDDSEAEDNNKDIKFKIISRLNNADMVDFKK